MVPENVEAIRAITGEADREESMARTDEAMGLNRPLAPTRTAE